MHLNTVLAPVSRELIEPEEGRFDWRSVDDLLTAARAHDLKLVLLWFGAWKNSMSTYAPGWVKRDWARFPRARSADGHSLDILSAFSPHTRDADARAFASLLRHLRSEEWYYARSAKPTKAEHELSVETQAEAGELRISRAPLAQYRRSQRRRMLLRVWCVT